MPLHRKLRFERQRPHTAQDLSRFGGLPPGLRDGRWPLFYNPELDEALPGTHVLTIETRSLELEVAPEVVALSLFISDPEMPWFFDDPTADLQVIALTADDLNAEVSAPQDVSSLLPLAAPLLSAASPSTSSKIAPQAPSQASCSSVAPMS